jgi:hypothetical protein
MTKRDLFWGEPLPEGLRLGWWCEQRLKQGICTRYGSNFGTITEAKASLAKHIETITGCSPILESGLLVHVTGSDPFESEIRISGF